MICSRMNAKPGRRKSSAGVSKRSSKLAVWAVLLTGCVCVSAAGAGQNPSLHAALDTDYPGVPKSSIYEVTIREGNVSRQLTVFQSSCPEYEPGYLNMIPVDQHPLKRFKGRSISWVNFSFSDRVTIQVHVLDPGKVPLDGPVKIYPARYGVTPAVNGNVVSFILTKPGQCSVEIGNNGYKNGLLIFANPPERDRPEPAVEHYYPLTNATPAEVNSVPAAYSGIYFLSGIHNVGVYHVPAHIKNIYFEPGSWVYGAIVIDGHSNVKIFGRGVLSGAKLNYRESHAVEAIHDSDRIDLEGIVLADTKYFAVRLLGEKNTVKWIKIVGGWTYNTDGIAAAAGSSVAHCFIWANDDSLKPYWDNVTISGCVVWQLNNGAVIQLGWGNTKATHVTISNVDVLHAEWNNHATNRGILSCIGDKFAKGGMYGLQQSFLIENLVTETPVPFIFNIRPNPASPDRIHGMTLKNWSIKMDMGKGYPNDIECADATNKFDGFVFDNFTLNGVKLTESNWIKVGRFVIKNLVTPVIINRPAAASQ
jgi:hypothetical protein